MPCFQVLTIVWIDSKRFWIVVFENGLILKVPGGKMPSLAEIERRYPDECY